MGSVQAGRQTPRRALLVQSQGGGQQDTVGRQQHRRSQRSAARTPPPHTHSAQQPPEHGVLADVAAVLQRKRLERRPEVRHLGAHQLQLGGVDLLAQGLVLVLRARAVCRARGARSRRGGSQCEIGACVEWREGEGGRAGDGGGGGWGRTAGPCSPLRPGLAPDPAGLAVFAWCGVARGSPRGDKAVSCSSGSRAAAAKGRDSFEDSKRNHSNFNSS